MPPYCSHTFWVPVIVSRLIRGIQGQVGLDLAEKLSPNQISSPVWIIAQVSIFVPRRALSEIRGTPMYSIVQKSETSP
ncbi:hypothetical protein SRHO_G00222290 [Serrasalmus rhombeus]